MADKPRCPPVRHSEDANPICCSTTKTSMDKKPCCVPVGMAMASSEQRAPEVDEKLLKAYEKLKNSNSNSLLKKYLTPDVFEELQYSLTPLGSSLLDVIQSGVENPDSSMGVYAPDADAYTVFAALFDPIIAEYHSFSALSSQPSVDWGNASGLDDLDPNGRYILSTRVRCARSIKGYPFAPRMTADLYEKLEKEVVEALSSLDGVHAGKYQPLSSMSREVQHKLINGHYLFKEGDKFMKAAKACKYWPTGRGIFLNDKKTFLVWVAEEDHIRIISMQDGGDIADIYQRMVGGVNKLKGRLSFVREHRLGYLTVCPTNLGTTIRASVLIRLPNLGQNESRLKTICNRYYLQLRGSTGEHTSTKDYTYDISNKRRLGLTEYETLLEMYKGVKELIMLEG